MLTLKLLAVDSAVVAERTHQTETYLAFKSREYTTGETIQLEISEPNRFVWVQLDEALAPSLIYLTGTTWEYPVNLEPEFKRAWSPKIFCGERHYLHAWLPQEDEILAYRNLALNPHDHKEDSAAYPHAYANVETRNDSTFFARNAIDGMIANESHGSFPYQSWGINQQQDAQLTIDFGRWVTVDKISLVLRGDYPHDSFWTSVTLEFSDGETLVFNPTNQLDRQFFCFSKKNTTSVTLKELIKHEDDSPFPALTEFEVYGVEADEK